MKIYSVQWVSARHYYSNIVSDFYESKDKAKEIALKLVGEKDESSMFFDIEYWDINPDDDACYIREILRGEDEDETIEIDDSIENYYIIHVCEVHTNAELESAN